MGWDKTYVNLKWLDFLCKHPVHYLAFRLYGCQLVRWSNRREELCGEQMVQHMGVLKYEMTDPICPKPIIQQTEVMGCESTFFKIFLTHLCDSL